MLSLTLCLNGKNMEYPFTIYPRGKCLLDLGIMSLKCITKFGTAIRPSEHIIILTYSFIWVFCPYLFGNNSIDDFT